ncbi:hypothetical protein ACIQNU_40250 [Streptomyces sp. NPDC091292]|uniref:hypothetical protein n=1 Tax=Streptomyces sp. NPDC091292 TaxID=3365991 RepID=UPI0037F39E2B
MDYRGASGDDCVLDAGTVDDLLDDKGIRTLIKRQLRDWGLEAANRFEGSKACSFGADSGWHNGEFKGLDAKNAIGRTKYRITSTG